MHTHPKQSSHNRPKSRPKDRHHTSPLWQTNEFYWGYLQEHGRAEITQRQVYHQRPLHRSTSGGSQSCEPGAYCIPPQLNSFLNNSDINLFQEALLVYDFSRHWSGLRVFVCNLAVLSWEGLWATYVKVSNYTHKVKIKDLIFPLGRRSM